MLPAFINDLDHAELVKRDAARKLRGIFRVPNVAYHAGPGLSSTGLKRLLKSPAHFREGSKEPTRAMQFGTAVHTAILEPELYVDAYAVAPDVDKRTKEGKAAWELWQAENLGKEVLTMSEAETITGIMRSFGEHDLWQGFRRDAEFEIAAYATCPETHVLRKAKADAVSGAIMADVKTIDDASDYAITKAIVDYGYHISAAYYLDIFNDLLDEQKITTFLWFFVEKKPPFGVKVVRLNAEMVRIGTREYKRGLEVYQQCVATNNWPKYETDIIDLDLPSYYLRKFQ